MNYKEPVQGTKADDIVFGVKLNQSEPFIIYSMSSINYGSVGSFTLMCAAYDATGRPAVIEKRIAISKDLMGTLVILSEQLNLESIHGDMEGVECTVEVNVGNGLDIVVKGTDIPKDILYKVTIETQNIIFPGEF